MSSHLPSVAEQLAELIREGIRNGRWKDHLPGRGKLAKELNASPTTLNRVLISLEKEGYLESQGQGRKRRIAKEALRSPSTFRITILPVTIKKWEPSFVTDLEQKLQNLGYDAGYASKSMDDLKMDPTKIIQLAQETKTDAWLIVGGSRSILNWFAAQETPAFAMGGGMLEENIGGTGFDIFEPFRIAIRRLIELGHTRIVLIEFGYMRDPKLGKIALTFLDEMEKNGLTTGPYNYPEWHGEVDGLNQCLKSLFQITPPTALIFATAELYNAAKSFLNQNNLHLPQDVSMICLQYNSLFEWETPSVSYVKVNEGKMAQPALQWIKQVVRGKNDRQQIHIPADFIEGESIGPTRSLQK